MNTTLIELPSVGCVVDVTTKMCYAQKQDNNPDLETGVPLEECDTDCTLCCKILSTRSLFS
jgi:hypothetical protein